MAIAFHKLQKIEIIVEGKEQQFVLNLLRQAGSTGYTIIRDISGLGEHGFHEGRLLFNEQSQLMLIMTIADQEAVEKIADALLPLFEKQLGIMVISDVQVGRLKKFIS